MTGHNSRFMFHIRATIRHGGDMVCAVAKWLKRQTADAEVLSSSRGMEELSRSSFNHCFTPSRCNGYLITSVMALV